MYPCGRDVELQGEIAMKATQGEVWTVILAEGDGKQLRECTRFRADLVCRFDRQSSS